MKIRYYFRTDGGYNLQPVEWTIEAIEGADSLAFLVLMEFGHERSQEYLSGKLKLVKREIV